MRRIGSEVVPEVLEIDSLSTPDQRQRRLAIEMEVPKIPEQPHALPVTHARNEGVHEHHSLGFARIHRRVGIRRHQADVVPDDLDRRPAVTLGQSVDVPRHGDLVVARVRDPRLS